MISVIIPTTRGGLGYLTALLPGLFKEPDQEIILIDNASKDGTTNYLSMNYDIKIKVNNPGRPFAVSNNQGARIAEGEHLLFLNNDTQITPGTLETMRKTFDIDPKIAVVGCLIYTMTNPKKVQHAGVMFNDDYVPYELGLPIEGMSPGIPVNDDRAREIREVPSVTAACMMVRKDIFFEVGGFDEGYINGWEDTDLVLRIREAGYKVWYNGTARIFHHHFGSKNAGRFAFEQQNRKRYDDIWVHTGRAKKLIGKKRT